MENTENKYEKNQKSNSYFYNNPEFTKEYFRNRVNDMKNEKDTAKATISEKLENWVNDHPVEFLAIGSIFVSIICWKLYQQLLTTAIFKANKKTLQYAAENFYMIRELL